MSKTGGVSTRSRKNLYLDTAGRGVSEKNLSVLGAGYPLEIGKDQRRMLGVGRCVGREEAAGQCIGLFFHSDRSK